MDDNTLRNLFDLRGKRALVVGGAEGIGYAIARAFTAYHAQVVIADRNQELLQKSSAAIGAEGFAVDVANCESVDRLVAHVAEQDGIDILVNCAAITKRESVLDMPEETWRSIIEVNLHGAHSLARGVGALMREQGRGGRMIFIVSTGAYRAAPNYGAYSASKAGVIMLCKTLALELASDGILVNAIAPTATDTSFTADYYAAHPEKRTAVAANHPLGRIAVPDDYMGTALYLASEASAFVTGTVMTVDGGKTAK